MARILCSRPTAVLTFVLDHVMPVALAAVVTVCGLVPPANAQTRTLTIAWDANVEPDIAGYVVMAGSSFGVAEQRKDAGLNTSCAMTLASGRRHVLWVHAYNRAGLMSAPSSPVEVNLTSDPSDDANRNGLPDAWEREYGVSDPLGDPDGDGMTNRDEWAGQTDPTLANRLILPEGATGFFRERLALVNPSATTASGSLVALFGQGRERRWSFSVPPRSRRTLELNTLPGLASSEAAIVVEVERGGVAIERTMRWGGSTGELAAGHTGKPVAGASKTWLLAEGDARAFDTWLLLANETAGTAWVDVDFLIDGGGMVSRRYSVAGRSRLTLLANAVPGVAGTSFATRLRSDVPIGVERAMYFTRPGHGWVGGHVAAGVAQASRTWVLAEGRTGPFFDTWLLMANPQTAPVTVDVTYLRPAKAPLRETRVLPPSSRTTVALEAIPGLDDTDVSVVIDATAPVVAERAMYWPGDARAWIEGHVSAGVTQLGRRWLLAEGEVGGAPRFESYVLVANPGRVATMATFTFLRESGDPVILTRIVPAESRLTLSAREAALGPGERFGVIVDTEEPVAVERSMYWNAEGRFWRGGTNETGTRVR